MLYYQEVLVDPYDAVFDWIYGVFAWFKAIGRRVAAAIELSDDDRAHLTQEEIDALEEDDETQSPGENDDDGGGGGSDDDGGDNDGDNGGDNDDNGKDDGNKGDSDTNTDDNGGNDGNDDGSTGDKDDDKDNDKTNAEITEPVLPTINVPGPEGDALKEAEKAAKEARQKFEDGDIDFVEYEEIKDKYLELKVRAQMAQDININSRRAAWESAQELFYQQFKLYRDNPIVNAAFVQAVNNAIQDPDTASMTDMELLLSVKKQIDDGLKGLGVAGSGASNQATGDDARRKAASQKANKDRDKAKKDVNLGDVPPADDDKGDSEFAWLDRLDGAAYEAAVARLTPEQLAKYEDSL